MEKATFIHQGGLADYYGLMIVRHMMDHLSEEGQEEYTKRSLPAVIDPLGFLQGVVGWIVGGLPEGVKVEFDDSQREMWGKLLVRRV